MLCPKTLRFFPLGLGKVARALGRREGCGWERDWDTRPRLCSKGHPSLLPQRFASLGVHGWSREGQAHLHGLCPPLGVPSVSPVRQVSQHEPSNQYARHEHRLGHLLQLVGAADQVPLRKRKVVPAWLSANRPSQPRSACAPAHVRVSSQHPPLTSLSLAPCFRGTIAPFSPALGSLALPVALWVPDLWLGNGNIPPACVASHMTYKVCSAVTSI